MQVKNREEKEIRRVIYPFIVFSEIALKTLNMDERIGWKQCLSHWHNRIVWKEWGENTENTQRYKPLHG